MKNVPKNILFHEFAISDIFSWFYFESKAQWLCGDRESGLEERKLS